MMVLLGGISVAVPGELAGYYEAWQRFGRLPWRRLVQPTIDMCRHGYRVQRSLADAIRDKEHAIRNNPSLKYVSKRCYDYFFSFFFSGMHH